jgi:hypothetical protein
MEEDGIQTCYLIDFYNKEYRIKDTLSLRNAISFILHNEKVDIIIFVGKISFFQLLLFKVPYRYEPKHLYFTVDFLESFDNDFKSSVLNIKNWDFGLFNYDVR